MDIVYALQMSVFEKERELEACTSESTQYRKQQEIDEIEALLRQLRMDLVYYCDALPYEKLEVLGEKYFQDQKRDLSKYEYEVAIESMDPDKAIEPFYKH